MDFLRSIARGRSEATPARTLTAVVIVVSAAVLLVVLLVVLAMSVS